MVSPIKKLYVIAVLLGSALGLLGYLTPLKTVEAQNPTTGWSQPIILSRDAPAAPGYAYEARILATQDGNVHVFWTGTTSLQNSFGGVDAILYYMRSNGTSWSRPVDILYSRTDQISPPALVVDSQAVLHALWTGGTNSDRLVHSTVPILLAGTASAWRHQVIANGNGISGKLALDNNGDLMVVYTIPSQPGLTLIQWSRATEAWSDPLLISGTDSQRGARTTVDAIATDGNNTIHVSWTVWGRADYSGRAFYARSTDGGQTWSPSLVLDPTKGSTYGVDTVNIQVTGRNQIHLIWLADALRRHQRSDDGGKTWTEPESFMGDVFGHNGIDQTALDSAGVLHVVGVGGWNNLTDSPYHTSWTKGSWSETELIAPGPNVPDRSRVFEWPELAITNGNHLHVVWRDRENIWYSTKTIDAPYIASQPLPAVEPVASSASPSPKTPTMTAKPELTPPPIFPSPNDTEPVAQVPTNGQIAFVAGAVPVCLLLALVLVMHLRR